MDEADRDTTYIYLIEEFTEERLQDRFLFLYKLINIFAQDRNIGDIILFNKKTLMNIVIDYFADISRLKRFHKIEKVNKIKIAAYLSFWVYKRKPLYINAEIDQKLIKEKPFLDDINEWFCIFIILSILYDIKRPVEHGVEENYIRFNSFVGILRYHLSYRVVTAQSLELALVGALAKPGFLENEIINFDKF